MKFRNFRFSAFAANLIVGFLYPVYKLVSAPAGSGMLKFLDSTFIISLFMLLAGVLFRAYQKGDLDRTAYILSRSTHKVQKPFDVYEQDRKEERESSFNYPLFTAIVLLATCGVLTAVCY